ncbi:MAG: dTDP-glucose 4,6-dehydratase [Flavobacteriales bacterium]|nr:dTDP-glucose 4,6-dehydratase [Flavobacteriales bacterium]
MKIIITGGAGFIGSHLIRRWLSTHHADTVINYDALTYAGNLGNLSDLTSCSNYVFIKGDINDKALLNSVFESHRPDAVIHLAAESHVDRSISGPDAFISTNVLGTAALLDTAVHHWKGNFEGKLFYHVSTDEVFGSLGAEGKFSETTAYDPRSPYSASKAASDHLVRAYHHTYGLPVVVSNCSNNFGSHQFPEKLIPLVINNIRQRKSIPVYGKGENVRDWLWVEDHARAIDLIFHEGRVGETYCIGANNEWKNIDLVKLLCELLDEKLGRKKGESASLITFVTDRPGHDARYAIDFGKLNRELGWSPSPDFRQQLSAAIDWYLTHDQWLQEVTSGAYLSYYEHHYSNR